MPIFSGSTGSHLAGVVGFVYMSECEYISFGGGLALHRLNEYGSKATASGSWWAEKPTPTIPTNKKSLLAQILLAGVVGFEPTDVGVRVQCLTTWLYPIGLHYVL